MVLRLWPRSRRLSIAPGRAARGSLRKCGRRRSPRGAQSLRERCVCVVCQSTSSCYSQHSRIFGRCFVVCVFLTSHGCAGNSWEPSQTNLRSSNAGKLNVPTTNSEKGRMTVVVHDRPMGYQDVEGGSGKGGSGVSGGSEGSGSEGGSGEGGGGRGVSGEGGGFEDGGGEGGARRRAAARGASARAAVARAAARAAASRAGAARVAAARVAAAWAEATRAAVAC